MSNSALINYTKLSPNKTVGRTHVIDTITIHCMAGQLSVESCGSLFAKTSTQASSNYGIGSDGRIALYVDEKDRSWCSSNKANDMRAITIEVASNKTAPYAVSDTVMASLINLVTDICQRNGITRLVWSNDKNTRVNHLNGAMTVHRDFAAKACPGEFLMNKMPEIANLVNARLEMKQEVAKAPVSGVSTSIGVYPKYTGTSTSIVSALCAVGERNTSFENRKAIALANGINGYTGTAAQNTALLKKLQAGELVMVGGKVPEAASVSALPPVTAYYPAYTGNSASIAAALAGVGEKDTSFNHRKKIAVANGIKNYTGSAAQNTNMVKLLKQGKLIKA